MAVARWWHDWAMAIHTALPNALLKKAWSAEVWNVTSTPRTARCGTYMPGGVAGVMKAIHPFADCPHAGLTYGLLDYAVENAVRSLLGFRRAPSVPAKDCIREDHLGATRGLSCSISMPSKCGTQANRALAKSSTSGPTPLTGQSI